MGVSQGEPLVTLAQGSLRGSRDVDYDGNDYLSFRGIPYAKPPIGELRFKPPVRAEKWNGVFDATKDGNPCYARDLFTMKYGGSEDCLVLNVFTKNLSESSRKPVMVWIHGGAFLYGSNSTTVYSPAFLMTQDVVMVSINYRLGILGFLNLEDSSAGVPGNAGMKDMVMALRWIQENIAQFSGDPNNVTVFGESAGAAAVHLLMLSPMTKNLLHKVIIQSASAMNYWAASDGCSLETICRAAGKPGFKAKELVEHLRSLPVEDLLDLQDNMHDYFLPAFARPFVPVVEKTDLEPTFLAENPIDILLQGKYNQIPVMTGFTNAEGMRFEFFKNLDEDLKLDFENNVPHTLGYKMGEEATKALGEKIKKYYYGNETPSRKNIDMYFDMMSDSAFRYDIIVGTEKLLLKSQCPIYVYQMTIETGLNFFKVIGKMTGKGVSHADDIGYLFKTFATPKIEPGSTEDIAIRRFVKLWTNFAAHGNPTPDPKDPLLNVTWKPVEKKEEFCFLEIGTELKMDVNPYPERIKFWREIYANSPSASKLA